MREITRARRWWLENRDKAPGAFDEELSNLVQLLQHEPRHVGLPARNMPRLRRAFLKRIRYYVYFRVVDDGERAQVLAFWHATRGRDPRL